MNSPSSNRRVVVIVGASSGIGAELAQQLDAMGNYAFILAGRRVTELSKVAASLTDAHAVSCDATKRAEVEQLAAEAVARYGRIDVWYVVSRVQYWPDYNAEG